MHNFIKVLKSLTRMLLDAFAGDTTRTMIEPQIKDLIENMFLNEYRSKREKSAKIETVGTPKGMLAIDTHTSLLAQIELLNKKLARSSLSKANMSQVQTLQCDFFGKGHENGRFSLKGSSEEAKFANF